MTAPLPNPFAFDVPQATSATRSPLAAEQASASESDASCALAVLSETGFTTTPKVRYPSRFRLDPNRFYLDIISEPGDPTPMFLRNPSPAFLKTLLELGGLRP